MGRASRTTLGIWHGLIAGFNWLGSAILDGRGVWFLAGATYGCLATFWLVGR